MPRNIFRVFNPKGSQEDRTEKRRAQLRHAQQNYRERKDRYTKALEQELAQGRAREAHLLQENTRLQETVQHLRTLVEAHGRDLSSSWPQKLDPVAQMTDDSWAGAYGSPSSILPSPAIQPGGDTPPSAARLADLDPTDVGMEFVLTLEEPCLDHLHGDPACPHESNNHALTVSGKLSDHLDHNTAAAPALPAAGDAAPIDYKAAPKAILESMLSLSSVLCVPDSGLTPVQAWNQVRLQPQFSNLELSSLQALAIALRDSVQCHGFGAVIEQDTFTDQVARALFAPRMA